MYATVARLHVLWIGMLPLFSYWLHWLLGYWGFGYLMCFGVFVIFGNSHQAKARKLSAQEHLLSSLYFCKVSKTL